MSSRTPKPDPTAPPAAAEPELDDADLFGPEDPAEYDKWFREQVAIGIADADDPNAEWISNEEANEILLKQLAEFEKRAKESGK